MKKQILALLAGIVGLAVVPAMAADGRSVNAQLAAVRAATADFHRLEVSQGAGWNFVGSGCVSSPAPGGGAMGYHHLNLALVGNPGVDPELPEVLVYAPTPSGGRRLVAVEWLVPVAISPNPPSLFGQTFHLQPVLQAWILHAWVWKHNPDGVFADFNRAVSCASP